jgi:hypothetical protein
LRTGAAAPQVEDGCGCAAQDETEDENKNEDEVGAFSSPATFWHVIPVSRIALV